LNGALLGLNVSLFTYNALNTEKYWLLLLCRRWGAGRERVGSEERVRRG
jgi:hypothetical protein